jgi:alkanesulfonate monooxygenase SsuD/methylene tetrahydromethanopterin reductase-like flavin-dependent oxidoreductase (luciferase family)
MKLDMLYEVDAPKPWSKPHPHGQREAEQRAYQEAVEQIRMADPLGFNTIWAVEHHFREGRSHCPAPEVLLGYLAGVTERIRLGFGVTLTPFGFTPPQRIAEKVATTDILSKGRVEWGTGRSTPMEQIAFGVDRARSREDFKEAIEIVCGMWREEYFEYESPRFSFPRRMVTPKPFQDPHPPAWMAAVSSGSAEVAGALGLGLLSLSIMSPLEKVAEQVAAYRRAAANATPLTDVSTNKVAAYTLVHVTDKKTKREDDPIWRSVGWWYKHLAEFTLQWELPNLSAEERDQAFPTLRPLMEGDVPVETFDAADMIIVGDMDTVVRKMKRYADLGIDQLICYMQFGYLEHESIKRTIEVLGKEVIPELAAYTPKRPELRHASD